MSFLDPSFLEQLAQDIGEQCLRQDTDAPLFHGSTDWHSAVHGHWASLWLASMMQRPQRQRFWLNRLSLPMFAQEIEYLQQHREFERPYGRAWILRLGALCHQLGLVSNTEGLLALSQDLLRDLRTTMVPNEREYRNRCWVVIQLHHWFSVLNDSDGVHGCQQWVRAVQQYMVALPEHDEDSGDFFSLWSVQCLCLWEVLGAEVLNSHLQSLNVQSIKPLSQLKGTVHHLGIHASRAWGCAVAHGATKDAAWKVSFEQHIQSAAALHPQWRHDGYAYTHWVPQFLVYALAQWRAVTCVSQF